MNKGTLIVTLALSAGIFPAWAQSPPPGTISRPPASAPSGGISQPTPTTPTYNAAGQGNLTFTNNFGAVYSVNQLAGQLQALRQAVDQTLPMLGAFTQTYSNSLPAGQGTLGGAISGILSGVLNRNNTNAAPSSTQGTNLLAVLQQMLTTNAPPSTPVNPTKFQDVVALQQRLQTIPPLLQTLNVGSTTNQFAIPSSTYPQNPPTYPQNPLPTGR